MECGSPCKLMLTASTPNQFHHSIGGVTQIGDE